MVKRKAKRSREDKVDILMARSVLSQHLHPLVEEVAEAFEDFDEAEATVMVRLRENPVIFAAVTKAVIIDTVVNGENADPHAVRDDDVLGTRVMRYDGTVVTLGDATVEDLAAAAKHALRQGLLAGARASLLSSASRRWKKSS